MPGPLKGLKVIDLTRVLAGPFCAMMLADMGAEVIKVERPGTGDDSRSFGPFQNGESAYFMSINRGKKSICLDLKNPEGKTIFIKLIKDADIVIENFKPGVMQKLGLSYDVLAKVNPRIIYAASSGFGHSGPYSKRPAYDLIIQGMGGLMSITGPGKGQPTKVGSSVADIFSGVFTTIGILAAVNERSQTGRGQMVDVAMYDCMVSILENAIARYTTTGVDPVPIGNTHPSISPFTSVKTSDGYINIACGNDILWKRLCDLIEKPELFDDKNYKTNLDRTKNMPKLLKILNDSLSNNTSEFWLKKFDEAQVPAGPINSISDIMKDPQIIARNMILELTHPKAGITKVPGTPIKFSRTPSEVKDAAPLLGQHTNEILKSIGYSDSQINKFKQAGII